jgi:zinc transporter 7
LKGKGSAGYLNLIGSTIHNTIDGLSIGLAFSTGDSSVYVPIVIAIFMHEIPRELGDVAILLKSRFSGCQTICSNGCINLLAVVGAVIGLSTSELSDAAQDYIMVFVAGNFIYIASDIWKHLFNDNWKYNIL